MSTSIHFRQLNVPGDLPALVALKNAFFEQRKLNRTTTVERQQQLMTYPGHNAARDNCVAVLDDDTMLVGHIWLWQQTSLRTTLDITVHPKWAQHGIGQRLLDWAVTRAREHGSAYLDAQYPISLPDEIARVQQNGFQPLGTYLNASLPAAVELPPLDWPAGYTLKPYSDVNDISLYTQAMNRCYGDQWGHMSDVSEDFMAQSFEHYPPQNVFLLFDTEEQVCGVVRVQVDEAHAAYAVDAPALTPDHRQPELYRALLLYALHVLRNNQPSPAPISLDSWGDANSSVAAFWQLGFECKYHAIGYRYYL